jgi:hypothetical protein
MKKKINGLLLLLTTIFIVGCANAEGAATTDKEADPKVAATENTDIKGEKEEATPEVVDEPEVEEAVAEETSPETNDEGFPGFDLLEVDGGDLSGYRQPNVVVEIGFGDREYWAFTNEYGQLVRVIADEIILQDDSNESVLSSGRYYSDEAKVPGVESDVLDEGHIIADSLGGVSNAYNITPQESTLNRHGDQAYMEKISVTQVEPLILKLLSPIQIRKRRSLQIISIPIR